MPDSTWAGASARNTATWKSRASGKPSRLTICARWAASARRPPPPDPEVAALTKRWSAEAGIQQRQVPAEEIVDRCIYALINEGARILEEGYAARAVDIDIIYINGYGFPAYRGGPMWYADTVGLKMVYERITEFQRIHGELWEPAPVLKKLAAEGRTFAAYGQQ